MMKLLFALFLFFFYSEAGFAYIKKTIEKENSPYYWKYAVISPDDTPFGKEPPSISIRLSLTMNPPQDIPDTEIVLFHYQNLNKKIYSIDNNWCCSESSFHEGKCNSIGNINIRGVKNWTKIRNDYELDETGTIVHWTDMEGYPYDPTTKTLEIHDKLILNTTGVWYFFLVQCNSSHSVDVTGFLVWRNPYGFLSALLFPFLPMHVCLSLAFLILMVLWVIYLIKYRENLMGLQHIITITIIIAFAENLLWSIDYVNNNITGEIFDVINMIGALLTASKLTILRTLILLVSIGYSITVPSLENRTKIYVILLTVVYGISNTMDQYVWVVTTMDLEFPLALEVFSELALLVTNLIYILWVSFALYHQVKTLKEQKQSEKLSMYNKFISFLLVFLLVSVILYFCQLIFLILGLRDSYWRVWWFWDAYWEVGYYVVVAVISYLWWPSQNNERYAYSTQLPQAQDSEEELDNVVTEEKSQIKLEEAKESNESEEEEKK